MNTIEIRVFMVLSLISWLNQEKGTLRVFLTFSDGRKIIAPVYWWQQYLGFPKRESGDLVRLTFEKIEDGRVFLTAAESVDEEDGPYEVL